MVGAALMTRVLCMAAAAALVLGPTQVLAQAAFDETQTQTVFQQRQPLRDRRWRHAQIARRRRKARCCGEGCEKAEIGDIKH